MTQADEALAFLIRGGPTLWVIAALSVATTALILWKLWRLMRMGAWSSVDGSVALWCRGDQRGARADLMGRRSVLAQVTDQAMGFRADPTLTDAQAKEETERVARRGLSSLRSGLRALELIATIAPLLGLLGTVLGMIQAFQALQEAGSRADPAVLAGGIWEALLTTAAGMAVAIPASAALTWFESIADRVQGEMEDAATRIFARQPQGKAD